MNLMRVLFALALLAVTAGAQAAADLVTGKWRAIDGEAGDPESVVEIYREGDELQGRIVRLFPKPGESANPVCSKCPGARKNEPILGMVILTGLEKRGGKWAGGELLDPESGNVYACEIWVEEGRLKVRGYLFFFYKTQTWLRYDG